MPENRASNVLDIIVDYGSPMQKPVVQRRALDFSCEGHYDPVTVMYSVNVTWDISNQHPLVREALLANRFRVDTFKFSVFPLDHGFMEVIHQFPQVREGFKSSVYE
jgi:hypothetical protein